LSTNFAMPEVITRTSEEIRRLADPNRHYRIMEVCGGHTHAIYRFGLKDLLPSNIELIHGPGCPVCVSADGKNRRRSVDRAHPNVIFAAFGDMMRVPGTQGSPLEHKARGMDVRIVYSPSDALKLAQANPDKHVMFFAIGFETTAPSTALTLVRAKTQGNPQFFRVLQSRHDHSRDSRHSRFSRHAHRRLHRTWARIDGDRLPAVRVDREERK
jgi:hydrogenase expression/formation protein HypD